MQGKWFHVLDGSQWWAFDLFSLCTFMQWGGHLIRVLPTICVLKVLQNQPGSHFLYLFYNLPSFREIIAISFFYNQNVSASHQIGFAP